MFGNFFKVKMSWGRLLSLTEQFQGGTADTQGCTRSSPSAPQGRHLQLEEVPQPWFHRRWGTALLPVFGSDPAASPPNLAAAHLGLCVPLEVYGQQGVVPEPLCKAASFLPPGPSPAPLKSTCVEGKLYCFVPFQCRQLKIVVANN